MLSITPISLSEQNLQLLFSSLLLFWTGMTRRAEEVLADQKECTPVNIGSPNAIRDMADPGLRPIEIAYDRLGTRLLFPDYFERG